MRLAQDLARHGERPALVEDTGVTSYAALAVLVDAATERHLLRVAEPLVLPVVKVVVVVRERQDTLEHIKFTPHFPSWVGAANWDR